MNNTVINAVLAEDEELILHSLVKRITEADMGFNFVGTAGNGKDALNYIKNCTPHVLFTDVQMPVMDGLELVKVVENEYPDIVKIVISGYDEFEYAKRAMEHGVREYLLKPISKDELEKVLRSVRVTIESREDLMLNRIAGSNQNQSYSRKEFADIVKEYIMINYNQEINFDQIAKNFNFSASYLSKTFTKYVGENPCKYLISIRINKAKSLLLSHKELTVKEIGEIVGYTDPFYFSHIFKSLTGKSPVAFRNSTMQPVSETHAE